MKNAKVAADPLRRGFFKRSGAIAGGVVTTSTLAALGAHSAFARNHHFHERRQRGRRSTYGELKPTADQNGEMILALPKDFRYVTFSKTGEVFGDGLVVPRSHDGMACFDGRGDTVRLIRNHEMRNAAGNFALGVNGPAHLTAMWRFAKEAAVAADDGLVYQTEDAGNNSGFYRFTPNSRHNLAAGGALEMLAVTGAPGANMFAGQHVGVRLPVHWVTIPVPDPALESGGMSCFAQGRAAGGAAFNRLEGIFRAPDRESIYFLSTSGGEAGRGQLWHYIPDRDGDTLVLVFQSPLGSVLDSPDNLCITPHGAMLFSEDDASGDNDTHPLAPGITDVNRLIGLGMAGEPFELAVNILNDSEFAGGCFSPDGEVLFVNLFGGSTPGSGMTCAIWGPWERGPL